MKITYTALLESAFHHGAGTSGNTARLRTQEVVQPDGSLALVPFLSANSVRHGLRDALAWHIAKTLAIPEGSLTKNEVGLLWSGGAVTKTGAETNLDLLRRIGDVIPQLGLLGYAAGSDIISGSLRVSDMMLICTENQPRLPIPATHRAAHYRGEEFGTRHDLDTSPVARFIDVAAGAASSTQMIYSVQTLKPGAELWGEIQTDVAATTAQEKTLAAAWHLWAPGGVAFLGAKTAVGYGRASLSPEAEVPNEVPWLTQHVLDHEEEITTALAEVAA